MTDIWTKSTFPSPFGFFSKILFLLLNVSEEYILIVCFFFIYKIPYLQSFFIRFFEDNKKTMLHTCPPIFILLYSIIWKQKSAYLCWQVLLVICLTEPWAIQPFTIPAEGNLWHFHLPGNNQCYLILCSLLSRPNVLNFLIWKTSNVIWPFKLRKVNTSKTVVQLSHWIFFWVILQWLSHFGEIGMN